MTAPIARSALYTPAEDPDMLRKAATTEADMAILDLEDSVGPDAKPTAREHLRTLVPEIDFADKQVAARINALDTEWWLDDLGAAVDAEVDQVKVPKVESVGDVRLVVEALRHLVADPPSVALGLETPRGLYAGPAIAKAARDLPEVRALGYGYADYSRAIGAPELPTRIRDFLAEHVIGFAALGGLDPIASTHLDIEDEAGLRAAAEAAAELGYVGMSAIHPAQVPVINEAFTPSQERVERARRLVRAFDASEKDSLVVEGVFLDVPIAERYRGLLERVERLQETGGD